MTSRSLTYRAVALALAVAALGASAASATPMTYPERQAIASRGIGAPTPPIVLEPGGFVPGPSRPAAVQTPQAKSSDGTDWGAIAGFVAAGLAASVALVAIRRHAPATPR